MPSIIEHKRKRIGNAEWIVDPVHSEAERIGRQAVELDWYIENMTDKPAWAYLPNSIGTDPWKEIGGVDCMVNSQARDIEFIDGTVRTRGPLFQIFVQKKDMP